MFIFSQTSTYKSFLVLLFSGFYILGCGTWPIESRNKKHPIGNSGGEFQQYTGNPYFHEGIDIMDDDPAPSGPYVLTKSTGTVELWLENSSSLYNGMILGIDDASNSTEKYWHLDFNSIQQSIRDADTDGTVVNRRTRVAQLVFWTSCDFHHLHFETCDNGGCYEPILDIKPRKDTNGPVIGGLSFTENGSIEQFPFVFPSTRVKGEVDIIARASDRQFVTSTQDHRTGVLKIQYEIQEAASGLPVVKTGSIIDFSVIPPNSVASILFRNESPFDSSSDYCNGETYYYVVTNVSDTDADDFQETFSWDTTAHPNGTYWVKVTAWDASNNDFSISTQVEIDN